MDLDEVHRAAVASEDGEHRGSEMFAVEGVRVRCDRRDRGRTAAVCEAEAVYEVFGIDARPHGDAHLGEFGAHVGEFGREFALRLVELGCLLEQLRAFGAVGGGLLGPVRKPPVARGIADSRHANPPGSRADRGKLDARRT